MKLGKSQVTWRHIATPCLVLVALVLAASWLIQHHLWPGFVGWLDAWWRLLTSVLLLTVVLMIWFSRHRPNVAPARLNWGTLPDGLGLVASSAQVAPVSESAPVRRWNWTIVTSVITAVTAVGALIFTGLSLSATEQGQFTDRYTKAIDQIGTQGVDRLQTRLGGIYSLERLARDSPGDQPTIIEVLSAFVRSAQPSTSQRSSWLCPANSTVGLDVQAAITVLGRRDTLEDKNVSIDLHAVCLNGISLAGADLGNVNLAHADLSRANLDHAYFHGMPIAADELGVYSIQASGMHVSPVNLIGATLAGASLADTDLSGVNIADADLSGVDLTHTKPDQRTITTGAKKDRSAGAWW